MKAAIFLLVLAAVAGSVYYFYVVDSPAYSTYKKFATAVAHGHTEEARELAENEDALGGEDDNQGQTTGGMPVDALTGIRYSLESETKNADGTLTVQAIQSVRFDPPGATSAMGAMTSKYRQTATLKKNNDQWLVVSLKSEFLETRNWEGREGISDLVHFLRTLDSLS